MYLHLWFLSSEVALRHAAKVQTVNKTAQCMQVLLVESLLGSCDSCNSEKEALEWRLEFSERNQCSPSCKGA